MAIITRQIASVDDGALVLSYGYDDQDLKIDNITAANTGARAYTVTATSTTNGATYSTTVQAGETIDQVIPQSEAAALQLSIAPNGKLAGVDWSIS